MLKREDALRVEEKVLLFCGDTVSFFADWPVGRKVQTVENYRSKPAVRVAPHVPVRGSHTQGERG